MQLDWWDRETLCKSGSLGHSTVGLLLGLLVLSVPGFAIADKNDCKSFRSGSKEYRTCIERVDKKNDKSAKTMVIDKPTTVTRSVASKKQAETELRSKSGKPLHATTHRYDSSREAKENLGMNRKPKGSYEMRLQPGDKVKVTKNAGVDGRQRELLIDRNTAKKRAGKDLAYKPYKN